METSLSKLTCTSLVLFVESRDKMGVKVRKDNVVGVFFP